MSAEAGVFVAVVLMVMFYLPYWLIAVLLAKDGCSKISQMEFDVELSTGHHPLNILIICSLYPVFFCTAASIGLLASNKSEQGVQVTCAGAILAATAWSLQSAKWLPLARTGPFRVVKVISLAAVALAPIIACSVATAQVLTLNPTPNPFRAQAAPELAPAYFLCVACYLFYGVWVALAASAALVGCAYRLYLALSFVYSVCKPAFAFLLTCGGDAAASPSAQDGGFVTSPSAGPSSKKRDLRGDGGDERGTAANDDRRQERRERSKDDRRTTRGESDSNSDLALGYTVIALPDQGKKRAKSDHDGGTAPGYTSEALPVAQSVKQWPFAEVV